jgi:hypothetical protein
MNAADAHLQRISDHVSAYLQIVRSQLLATVPKGVVHCIVVPAKDTLLAELQVGLMEGVGFELVEGWGLAVEGTSNVLQGVGDTVASQLFVLANFRIQSISQPPPTKPPTQP